MSLYKKFALGSATLGLLAASAMPVVSMAATNLVGDDSLGTLFVLDMLFNDNDNGILHDNGTALGDLFILDQLFGGNGGLGGGWLGGGNSLGRLFLLNELFDDNDNGILGSGGGTSLGDLFILNQLFD